MPLSSKRPSSSVRRWVADAKASDTTGDRPSLPVRPSSRDARFTAGPMLQRDHGDVELADVQGKKIYVHLKGACSGCMMEAATLGGIQQKMIEALGELVQVLPSSHMPVEA